MVACRIVLYKFEATAASASPPALIRNKCIIDFEITGGSWRQQHIAPWCGGRLGTAFDNLNLLSAARVEHERPYYRFEKKQIETAMAAV